MRWFTEVAPIRSKMMISYGIMMALVGLAVIAGMICIYAGLGPVYMAVTGGAIVLCAVVLSHMF